MAESTEVLIFPNIRISQLKDEVRESGDRFRDQSTRTWEATKETFRPGNLIAHHKGSLIASAVSLLLFGKLAGTATRVIAPKIKWSGLLGLMEAGWALNLLRYSYKLYRFVSDK
jgi:hypothetical protein